MAFKLKVDKWTMAIVAIIILVILLHLILFQSLRGSEEITLAGERGDIVEVVVNSTTFLVNRGNSTEDYLENLRKTGLSDEDISRYSCERYLFKNEGNSSYLYGVKEKNSNREGLLRSESREDTFENISYVVRESTRELSGIVEDVSINTSFVNKVYLLPDARVCVFELTNTQVGDKRFRNNVGCPEEKRYANYSTFRTCIFDTVHVGSENISVPAGAFSTEVYRLKSANVTYWEGELPFPIKIEDETTISQLVSYTVKQ